CMQTLDLPLTF
nr:immunoglobulin light chain junction region [Macaca mulatta]MOX08092.1 immunoglobulin light chain junction region [Macaca mulatta]MOX09740.1 immunoglobulin light chain junction region [Macaca mulatta]